MARKGLLSNSLERTLSSTGQDVPAASAADMSEPTPRQVQPRSGNPTVKRFKETFDELRGETVQEIDTSRIGPGKFTDRFDAASEIDGLVASIQESGQQIPILLRHAPAGSGFDYEPVYGRRRIAACRQLGILVKAHITDIDDEALIVAQGLENSERLENSFIEKAAFIVQLRDSGFKGKVIAQAIGLGEAEISRMVSIIQATPEELVTAIGPAHGVGRRQWASLSEKSSGLSTKQVRSLIDQIGMAETSSDRFAMALSALTQKPPAPPRAPREHVVADGRLILVRRKQRVELRVSESDDSDFVDWVIDQGETLYEQWKAGKK
ncbi:plasmid partitioning protein RepB [Yangia sp. PrR004]|nr:plasmid partitioning protein RepB [Salipiger sp. PrR004]